MIGITEYRPHSMLKVKETKLTRAKYPVIDAHNHLRHYKGDVGLLVEMMDEWNIARIIDLDGSYNGGFEYEFARFAEPYPDRFSILCQVDMYQIDDPAFGKNMAAHIKRCKAMGAAGIKFFKRMLGLAAKDAAGNYILPDDERLIPVWEAAAENNLPVLAHIADPVAFFLPTDRFNERAFELDEHPDWSYYNKGLPGFEQLLEAQCNMLARNPQTTFVIAHIGSVAEDLERVGQMLDQFPNMYVDTAERIAELGRQPYSSGAFLRKYADRVLYGTDLNPNAVNTSANYRFFETMDEYFPYNSWDEHNQGCWNIYGVGLEDEVLKKIYFENAKRVFHL